MTADIFRMLQKRLNKYFLGFPATEYRVTIQVDTQHQGRDKFGQLHRRS